MFAELCVSYRAFGLRTVLRDFVVFGYNGLLVEVLSSWGFLRATHRQFVIRSPRSNKRSNFFLFSLKQNPIQNHDVFAIIVFYSRE